MATLAKASCQVRRIVRLEARASRRLVRWDRARRRAVHAKAQVSAVLDEVSGLDHRLTDRQLAELRRACGAAAAVQRGPARSAALDVRNYPTILQ